MRELPSRATLDIFVPFFVEIEADGRVFDAGRSIQKIYNQEIVGLPIEEVFRPVQPPNRTIPELVSHSLTTASMHPILLEETRTRLKFKVVVAAGTQQDNAILIGLPILTGAASLTAAGLTWDDFPPQSQSIEFVQLAETFEATTQDLHRAVTRLNTKRKALRDALVQLSAEQRQAQMLSLVAQHTDNSVVVTDPHGRIEWVNASFERITGYSLVEAVGKTPGELLQREGTDPETVRMMATKQRSHEPYHSVVRNFRKDGEPIWLDLEVRPMHDAQGEIIYFIGIQRDITKDVKSEESIRRRDQVMSAVAKVSREFLKQEDWREALKICLPIVGRATLSSAAFAVRFYVSDEGRQMCTGFDRWSAEPANWPALGSVPLDLEAVGLGSAVDRLAQGETIRYADFPESAFPRAFPHRIATWIAVPILKQRVLFGALILTRPEGTDEWSAPEVNALETAARVFGVAVSRSEQSQNLRRANEKLDSALDGGSLSMLVIDPKGHTIEFDHRFAAMAGRDIPGNLTSIDQFESWLHPEDRLGFEFVVVEVLSRASRVIDQRFRIQRADDGTYRWIRIRAKARGKASAGTGEQVFGTARDVTTQVMDEMKLERMVEELDDARRTATQAAASVQQELLTRWPATRYGQFAVRVISIPSKVADGDFYDLVTLSDTTLDVVVGDVMGKGLTAALVGAGVKAQISRTLGLLAVSGTVPSPAQIMQVVHDLFVDRLMSLECFVTLDYVRIDASAQTLELVDCGHTRTLIWSRASGTCRFVSGDAMPLGIVKGEFYESTTVNLEPGDLVVLYSDGVTELPRETGTTEELGESGLAKIVQRAAAENPEEPWVPVEAALKELAAVSQLADDFTCVCIGLPDSKVVDRYLTSQVPTDVGAIDDVRGFLTQALERSGFAWSELDLTLFELAAVEAFTNIVRHAYSGRKMGRIEMHAEPRSTGVALHFVYYGEVFQPPSREISLEPRMAEGGYGLDLIDAAVDSVDYSQDDRGRMWISLFKRPTIVETN